MLIMMMTVFERLLVFSNISIFLTFATSAYHH